MIVKTKAMKKIKSKMKLLEEHVKELEEIIDNTPIGLYIADGEGNVIKVNKSHTRITGMSPQDFIGKNLKDLEESGKLSGSVTHCHQSC